MKKEKLLEIIQEVLDDTLEEKRKKKKKKKKGTKKKDACYRKVKRSAKVWPSAYASGRLVQCRKVGAANYGNKSKKQESLREEFETHDMYDPKTGKKYVATKKEDHEKMAAKGYTHVDPKEIRKIIGKGEGDAAGMKPFIEKFGKDMEEEIINYFNRLKSIFLLG